MPLSKSSAIPKPGDLIEIYRTGYRHWAVYVGNDYVIHLAPPGESAHTSVSSIMSVFKEKAVIKKELLEEVAGTNKYKVNNKYDNKYPPLPVSSIIKNAEEKVGEEITYSLTKFNCEHYVTDLRYGIRNSDQVNTAVTAAAVAGLGLVATLGVIGAIACSRNSRKNEDDYW